MTHTALSRTAVIIWLSLFSLLSVGCGSSGDTIEDSEDLAIEELQELARKALRSKRWADAQRYYQNLTTRFPFGDHAEDALLELAFAQYRANEQERAIATVERFMRTYPLSEDLAYAYFLRGVARSDQGISITSELFGMNPADNDQSFIRMAFRDFREVVDRFPESDYAADARQRMLYLRNILASHEISVARYYLEREAWIAASRRAQRVIDDFHRTPSVADALAIQVITYRAIGQTDLAEANRRVLAENFPGHTLADPNNSGEDSWLARLWLF
jgi:outer membrane protein assembly factor BamD